MPIKPLAMVLLKARGFTEKDFAKYHPGGSLGKAMLTTVSDIMRKDTELASLGHSASVDDAITAMSKSRAGACVIVDEDGSLTGVFTHGDFARAFSEHKNVRDMLVTDFMTKNPITVQASSLAAEVLNTIGTHRVDDLVVLDGEVVVGLVDTQDFARLKLF